MEQPEGGSAARELATPESVHQDDESESSKAPSAKEFETETDEKLPADQEAMQPDSS